MKHLEGGRRKFLLQGALESNIKKCCMHIWCFITIVGKSNKKITYFRFQHYDELSWGNSCCKYFPRSIYPRNISKCIYCVLIFALPPSISSQIYINVKSSNFRRKLWVEFQNWRMCALNKIHNFRIAGAEVVNLLFR